MTPSQVGGDQHPQVQKVRPVIDMNCGASPWPEKYVMDIVVKALVLRRMKEKGSSHVSVTAVPGTTVPLLMTRTNSPPR